MVKTRGGLAYGKGAPLRGQLTRQLALEFLICVLLTLLLNREGMFKSKCTEMGKKPHPLKLHGLVLRN